MASAPVVISVGGGKGGVGKSTVSIGIAAELAQKGYRTGLIDADLGGANLHTCMGMRPRWGLQDFLSGRKKKLEDIIEPLPWKNGWLIGGASDILELANPKFSQKRRIVNNLKNLPAQYILVDLGAGTHAHTADFYGAFPHGILITDGMPTSVENCYGYLKNGIIRGLLRLYPAEKEINAHIRRFSDPRKTDGFATMHEMIASLNRKFPHHASHIENWLRARKSSLVINMLRSRDEIGVARRFSEMAGKYLGIRLMVIGHITFSASVAPAMKARNIHRLPGIDPELKACLSAIVENLLTFTRAQ